ncbi:hypothetical protein BU14_0127s0057 [Porphyra umbilicalis]|uniref:Uncharacterized protein n=1 Tax=Porphyra umbilicalis TaxID=2786 RepID=A0A1X6PB26_PORUM|nr:hypothetical protein BU14_0127s0057 [Porphyra umbilicalis]|eukprot:OSX77960.1 hypothetical protein BU14_0127s0057 [Porphyra umbilicalis]
MDPPPRPPAFAPPATLGVARRGSLAAASAAAARPAAWRLPRGRRATPPLPPPRPAPPPRMDAGTSGAVVAAAVAAASETSAAASEAAATTASSVAAAAADAAAAAAATDGDAAASAAGGALFSPAAVDLATRVLSASCLVMAAYVTVGTVVITWWNWRRERDGKQAMAEIGAAPDGISPALLVATKGRGGKKGATKGGGGGGGGSGAARGAPAPRDAAAASRSTHSPPSWHPTPPYPRRFSRPRGRRIPPAPPPRRAASAFPRRAPPAAPGRASGLVRWGGRRWRRGPLGGGGPVATTARALVATLRATAVHPLWSVATAVAPGVEQRGSAAIHPRAATAAA